MISRKNPTRADIVDTYDYVDELGNLLYQVCRTEEEEFFSRRPMADGWKRDLSKANKVLYHLPAVVEAIKEGEYIYIVEGEKDADNLEELGFRTTCNPLGPGKWEDKYSDTLEGANLVIIPDADKPGLEHAYDIIQSLVGKASDIKIIEPKEFGFEIVEEHGEDVTDWIKTILLYPRKRFERWVRRSRAIDARDWQYEYDFKRRKSSS